jgi:hypothetical protein
VVIVVVKLVVVAVVVAAGVKVVVVVVAAAAAFSQNSIVDTIFGIVCIPHCPCLYPATTAGHCSCIWESSLPVKDFERFELNCTTMCANKLAVSVG